jgi:hypothetical protein
MGQLSCGSKTDYGALKIAEKQLGGAITAPALHKVIKETADSGF